MPDHLPCCTPRRGGLGRVRNGKFGSPPDSHTAATPQYGKSHQQEAAGAAARSHTKGQRPHARRRSQTAQQDVQERSGKSQIISRAYNLRNRGMEMRPMVSKLKQKYSTLRGRPFRMTDADLEGGLTNRRAAKRKAGPRRMQDRGTAGG